MKCYCLLLLLFCCRLATAAEPVTVRALTFNLRYINSGDTGSRTWVSRRDDAAALIQREAADFIGVQEAFRSMIDDVRQRVPGLGETGVGREDGKEKGEYSAILFKESVWEQADGGTFWLSDTPEVPSSCTWGNKVTRICTWGRYRHRANGAGVFVFNTHFDHESQPAREKAAALILERIRTRGSAAPVLLMGDLNAAPDNPAIQTLTTGEPSLTDAWKALNPSVPAAESGTFHFFSGRQDGARIDYLFTSPGLTATECRILRDQRVGMYPSDHFPVRSTLLLSMP